MAFFQDLKKNTSDMMEISKLNSSINGEKAAIMETQKKIGEAIYALYSAGEQLPEAVLPDLQAIAEKYQSITDLENKITEIKAEAERYKEAQAQAQAEAKAKAQADAQARANAQAAGQPVQPVQPIQPQAVPQSPVNVPPAAAPTTAAPAAGKFCVSCGSPIASGVAFCSKCGTKVV